MTRRQISTSTTSHRRPAWANGARQPRPALPTPSPPRTPPWPAGTTGGIGLFGAVHEFRAAPRSADRTARAAARRAARQPDADVGRRTTRPRARDLDPRQPDHSFQPEIGGRRRRDDPRRSGPGDATELHRGRQVGVVRKDTDGAAVHACCRRHVRPGIAERAVGELLGAFEWRSRRRRESSVERRADRGPPGP